ncbi:glycosyl hydrolase [Actinoplanes lobatus]|uniref:Exo-alpha-(1->6)-L-arabinopyranosidase n=2 Tax=Actinoplanes lobatus TaxID=113568 RepID=A0A7W7HHL5_9ACTN|nr:glycoside hydrolase family 3 N-terminal domain-containing protein [Actinoplanes lobatus]MBB4750657.1 beta-glucosidase [Actinoplanes lobatus]GGN69207.1 glycosyl hydrolase [Actinoplanes lobatus]GIE44188.1 glycosyl hydrolase [Actinoplanes lobatus]
MSTDQAPPPAWRDPGLPVSERVGALLAEMTLEEKVAQLGSRWLGKDKGATGAAGPEPENGHDVAPMESEFGAGAALEDASRHGLGHLTRVYGSYPVSATEGAAELVRQQRIVMESSRLGIPAIVHEECLTGFTMHGASVYPAAINWGATFDPELVERMAAAIGRDMAALGVHQGLSPVLDVVRDYRWGRVEESIGEDPYLVAMVGSAYVRGLQSAGVIATLKHFAGYSASRGARNHGPVPMGRRELLDVILPPFETAIRAGGAGSVMNSYADVDGVPAGADPWLLTELLRDEWGFTGTVVSDYWSIPFLAGMHRVAAGSGEAGALALAAGIDVELPDTIGYGDELVARVRRGEVPEELVDRAARRLLTQKAELGLLDDGWTPEASVAAAGTVTLDSAENRRLARELAERSIVLLDPGTVLPLTGPDRTGPGRIAVIGPCADDASTFLGCYAFPNHVLPRYPGVEAGIAMPSAAESVRAEFPDAEIAYAKGCAVDGDDRSGFAGAVAAAAAADVCLAFVGDLAGLFGRGTSGEGCDAADLRLPGVQGELLDAVLATGTPVVVVVVSGRPYALGDLDGRAAALVQAFMPGEEGGPAIAGVLSGRVQPSGRLPVQIPRTPGGQPGTYLQPRLGAEHTGVSNLDPTPMFPFGHGRSYTSFTVGDLRISESRVPTDAGFTVTVRVRNTGDRDGAEVVQLYLADPVAQVTRPVRQLAGFQRVELAAGAAADVTFAVHTDRTAFTGRDMRRLVEPGELRILVGTSAGDLPCEGSVELTGPVRPAGADRRLVTGVEVRPADS